MEDAADSLSSASAQHTATAALSESLIKGADSPLSLWVFKLSKRLHIGKINSIRGTRGECGERGGRGEALVLGKGWPLAAHHGVVCDVALATMKQAGLRVAVFCLERELGRRGFVVVSPRGC